MARIRRLPWLRCPLFRLCRLQQADPAGYRRTSICGKSESLAERYEKGKARKASHGSGTLVESSRAESGVGDRQPPVDCFGNQ